MALQNAINKASEWLDFFNGGYRSRVQAGTLTANQIATLPDKTGTFAFLDDVATDLSIANRTSTTLDILSSSGDGDTIPAATTTLAGLLTGADKAKLNDIQSGAINQTTVIDLILGGLGDHAEDPDPHPVYRLKSVNIPANEITGTFQDSQIPSSVARDTEVAAAITAHEAALDPHPGYRLESEQIPTTDVADLAEFVRDTIGATLAQGSNITITPDDPGNTITISATGGSGGGFTPVLQQYETPGITSLFQAPTGAARLKGRIIAGGGGGGGGRQGATGSVRAGGGGGGPGGIVDFDIELATLATYLGTTVSNLYFSLNIAVGGAGGAGGTTADSNGTIGGNPGSTVFSVRVGTGGGDTQIAFSGSSSGQRGGAGTTSGGSAGGTPTNGMSSNGVCMWSATPGGTGTVGGAQTGQAPNNPVSAGGGSGGQGISATEVGALGPDGAVGGRSQYGFIGLGGTTTSKNAVQHGVAWVPGGGGAGGDSTTTSRNGGNGYRGGGGGGGAGSTNGTPAGNGGNGGNGYACLLWY